MVCIWSFLQWGNNGIGIGKRGIKDRVKFGGTTFCSKSKIKKKSSSGRKVTATRLSVLKTYSLMKDLLVSIKMFSNMREIDKYWLTFTFFSWSLLEQGELLSFSLV